MSLTARSDHRCSLTFGNRRRCSARSSSLLDKSSKSTCYILQLIDLWLGSGKRTDDPVHESSPLGILLLPNFREVWKPTQSKTLVFNPLKMLFILKIPWDQFHAVYWYLSRHVGGEQVEQMPAATRSWSQPGCALMNELFSSTSFIFESMHNFDKTYECKA